jgi:hypothetical protein
MVRNPYFNSKLPERLKKTGEGTKRLNRTPTREATMTEIVLVLYQELREINERKRLYHKTKF